MPQPGTLAALKELFKARRTVTVATVLTPADIGRSVFVNAAAPVNITMPVIPGIPPTVPTANDGVSALGEGAAFCIINATANAVSIVFPTPIRPPAAADDTYNIGQAGPVVLAGQNNWAILVSDGAGTNPGDWLVIQG